jgi:hypothetical protein
MRKSHLLVDRGRALGSCAARAQGAHVALERENCRAMAHLAGHQCKGHTRPFGGPWRHPSMGLARASPAGRTEAPLWPQSAALRGYTQLTRATRPSAWIAERSSSCGMVSVPRAALTRARLFTRARIELSYRKGRATMVTSRKPGRRNRSFPAGGLCRRSCRSLSPRLRSAHPGQSSAR